GASIKTVSRLLVRHPCLSRAVQDTIPPQLWPDRPAGVLAAEIIARQDKTFPGKTADGWCRVLLLGCRRYRGLPGFPTVPFRSSVTRQCFQDLRGFEFCGGDNPLDKRNSVRTNNYKERKKDNP